MNSVSRRYEDGTLVTPTYYNGKLSSISIETPGEEKVTFERTNRPISEYAIPERLWKKLTDGSLAGKKVLDVGTGGGKAVFQMRRAGVEAFGVDIFLDGRQTTRSFFIEANMVHMPVFSKNEFDMVIQNQSFFQYYATRSGEKDFAKGLQIMKELARVLSPGGQIVLGSTSEANVIDILKEFPNLKIVDRSLELTNRWVIIEKLY